jgi:cell division protein FtsN
MLVGGCLLLVAIAWIVVFVVVLLNATPEGAVE